MSLARLLCLTEIILIKFGPESILVPKWTCEIGCTDGEAEEGEGRKKGGKEKEVGKKEEKIS